MLNIFKPLANTKAIKLDPIPHVNHEHLSKLLLLIRQQTIANGMIYFILLAILILFSSSSMTNSLEIISQREPGEATSSLIQDSGLSPTNSSHDANQLINQAHSFNATEQNASDQKEANSSSSSDSTNNDGTREEEGLIMGVITANIVIFIIGLCGNTVVILVILKFTRIETVTDIYILNLAFADLMFITGLVFLITTMFIDHWVFGNLMCKVSCYN